MLLEGKDLSYIYDLETEDGDYVLKDINIAVDSGEMIGIMGPSGSGKSTLLYLLSGMKNPVNGTVFYKDFDIHSLTQQESSKLRRKEFGFIYQRHFLIDYLSILDNILIAASGNLKEAEKRALELLEELGIGNLAHKKPAKLSVGQKQRAAVARALINKPSMIFADEPTSALDHRNAVKLMKILKQCSEEAGILVVTHDETILIDADRIVQLRDGRITD